MAATAENWTFRAIDIWYTIQLTKGRRPAPAVPEPAWSGPEQGTGWLGVTPLARRKGLRWICG
jgi:NAD(P)-dependent dehydrogenase (short-subunit alcohol dehydrogenase family)